MKGTLLFSKIKINVTFSFNIFKQKIKIPWFSSNDTDSRTTFCEKITVILRQRGGKRLNEEAGFEKNVDCMAYTSLTVATSSKPGSQIIIPRVGWLCGRGYFSITFRKTFNRKKSGYSWVPNKRNGCLDHNKRIRWENIHLLYKYIGVEKDYNKSIGGQTSSQLKNTSLPGLRRIFMRF